MVRMQKGLRQWDVARRAGIAETYLSKIETGRVRPNSDVLGRIARILEVAPEALLEEEPGAGGNEDSEFEVKRECE